MASEKADDGVKGPKSELAEILLATPKERSIAEEYKERITDVYRAKNPAKASEVDALLVKYKAQEHILYLKVCKKYEVEPKGEYKGNSPFGKGISALGTPTSSLPFACMPIASNSSSVAVTCSHPSSVAQPVNSGTTIMVGASPNSHGLAEDSVSQVLAFTTSSTLTPSSSMPFSRDRSRSPKDRSNCVVAASDVCKPVATETPMAHPPLEVWVVNCIECRRGKSLNSDELRTSYIDDQTLIHTMGVFRSKASASNAAEKAMKAQRAVLHDHTLEDLSPLKGDLIGGFHIKRSDGAHGFCKWLASRHSVTHES